MHFLVVPRRNLRTLLAGSYELHGIGDSDSVPLVNPLEAKNSCSPTVKVKSDPHSTHLSVLSESMMMTSEAFCVGAVEVIQF